MYFIGIIGIGAGQKELDLIMFALCSVLLYFRQKKRMVASYKWWYCFSVGVLEECFSTLAKRRAVSDWRIGGLIGPCGTRPDKFHSKSDFKWNIIANMAQTIKLEFIHCYFFYIWIWLKSKFLATSNPTWHSQLDLARHSHFHILSSRFSFAFSIRPTLAISPLSRLLSSPPHTQVDHKMQENHLY